MQTHYSSKAMQESMAVLQDFFEQVALIDPIASVQIDPATLQESGPYPLAEAERGNVCLSAQCLAEKSRFSKLRVFNGRVYNTIYQPVEVDERALVLLLANDVTDCFCSDADGRGVDPAALADLSRVVEQYERWIYHDFITGVYNRRFLEQSYLPTLDKRAQQTGGMSLALIRINSFNSLFESYGREATDRLLGYVASLLQQLLSVEQPGGMLCRISNNTFVLSAEGQTRAQLGEKLAALYDECYKEFRASVSQRAAFTLTMVTAQLGETGAADGKQLLALLDRRITDAHVAEKKGLVTD